MRSIPLFIAIVIAFGLSLIKHISVLMYPLSAIIFYSYLPVLYASSRCNILHHAKNKELFHIKFYPMELSMWLVSTCFFAFVLAHLLADLLFPYREHIYHFTIFLIVAALVGIIYYELEAKKNQPPFKKRYFEYQGILLSFQFLFIMILLFVINH